MLAMRHLFLALHAYLVGLAQKRELLQQVMPISHRYVMVAISRFCLGRSSYASHSKLWRSLCPPNKSGPGIKFTDFDAAV